MIVKNKNAQMMIWSVVIGPDSIFHRYAKTRVTTDDMFDWAKTFGEKIHQMNLKLRADMRKGYGHRVLEHDGVKVTAPLPAILQVCFGEISARTVTQETIRLHVEGGRGYNIECDHMGSGSVVVRWAHALIAANFRLAELDSMRKREGVSSSRLAMVNREYNNCQNEIIGMRSIHESMCMLIEEAIIFSEDAFYVHRPTNTLGIGGPVESVTWDSIPVIERESLSELKAVGVAVGYTHPDIAEAATHDQDGKYLELTDSYGASHYMSEAVPWTKVTAKGTFEHILTPDQMELMRDNADLLAGFWSLFMRGLLGTYEWDNREVAIAWSDFCKTLTKLGITSHAPALIPDGVYDVIDKAPSWLGGTSATERRSMMSLWSMLLGRIQVSMSVIGDLKAADRKAYRNCSDEIGANPLNWSTASRVVLEKALTTSLGNGLYKGTLPGGTEVNVAINGTKTFAGEARLLILGGANDPLALTNSNFAQFVDKLFYSLMSVDSTQDIEVRPGVYVLRGDYGALNTYITPSLLSARDLLVI